MKDTLIIGQRMGESGRYRIQWAFPDGELGGYLGQDKNDGSEDPPEDKDAWDLQGRRKTVPIVQEPGAACEVTGA